MRREGKCRRTTCGRRIERSGLCAQHYRASNNRGYIDATPVRQHITALNNAGMSYRDIALDAAMTATGIFYIVNSGRTVQKATADRILRIPIGGDGLVPCIGTRRRIQALAALGWPQKTLAARIGEREKHVSQFMRRERITADKARRVKAVFAELCMTEGPSDQCRKRARALGWFPPLAWDDIDNPDENPDLTEQPATFMDRYLEMRDTLQLTDPQIAARMGIQLQSLHVNLRRHDRRPA